MVPCHYLPSVRNVVSRKMISFHRNYTNSEFMMSNGKGNNNFFYYLAIISSFHSLSILLYCLGSNSSSLSCFIYFFSIWSFVFPTILLYALLITSDNLRIMPSCRIWRRLNDRHLQRCSLKYFGEDSSHCKSEWIRLLHPQRLRHIATIVHSIRCKSCFGAPTGVENCSRRDSSPFTIFCLRWAR